jgi:hypothetical protein
MAQRGGPHFPTTLEKDILLVVPICLYWTPILDNVGGVRSTEYHSRLKSISVFFASIVGDFQADLAVIS